MKRCKTVMLSDIISINGHDYYVSEINTKGNREILELDIVNRTEGQPLTVEYVHNVKSGECITNPVLSALKLFFCPKSHKWKLA